MSLAREVIDEMNKAKDVGSTFKVGMSGKYKGESIVITKRTVEGHLTLQKIDDKGNIKSGKDNIITLEKPNDNKELSMENSMSESFDEAFSEFCVTTAQANVDTVMNTLSEAGIATNLTESGVCVTGTSMQEVNAALSKCANCNCTVTPMR